MRSRWLAVWLVALPLLGGWDLFRSDDEDVAAGNRSFLAGELDDALMAYRRALTRGRDVAGIHFDIGTALYEKARGMQPGTDQQMALAEAELAFRVAADSDDPALKSSAYYNLGNTLFQVQRFDDAVQAYAKALRANPKNADARYNLELAQRQRKKMQQQQQQQQQPGDKQPKPDDQQQPEQQPEQQPKPEQGEQPQPQEQPQEQPSEQPDPEKPGSENPEPKQQEPKPPEPQQQPGQPKPEPGQDQQQQQQQQGAGEDKPEKRGEPKGEGEQPAERKGDERRDDRASKLAELERRSEDLRTRRLRDAVRRSLVRRRSQKDW